MTLGQKLKSMRDEQGISIEQLSAETRISTKIVAAIESDDYQNLPARAIIRGFIINYCRALGHDGEQILAEYKDGFEENVQARSSKSNGHEGYAFEQNELDQNRKWLLILSTAGLFFVFGALFVLKPKLKRRSHAPEVVSASPSDDETSAITPPISALLASPTPSSSPTPASEQLKSVTVVATPTPKATPIPAVKPSPASTPSAADPLKKGDELEQAQIKVRISLKSLSDTYVKYQCDNKDPMLIILREGRFLVLKGQNQISFEAQDPDKLLIRLSRGGNYEPLHLNKFQITKDKPEITPIPEGIQKGNALPAELPPPKP